MADALHEGAAALQDLIHLIGTKGNADLEAAANASGHDRGDSRDYRAMAAMVQQDLETNLHHQSPAHREGYLRALTDLLSLTADGAGPGDEWDPIRSTAAAFAPQEGAAHG